jgi:hypothetical protein
MVDHWRVVCDLHCKWKRKNDLQLRIAKYECQNKIRSEILATTFGSKARRAHQLVHKNASTSLPSVMKHPNDSTKLITGHAVNETWDTSATATRPNTMPAIPTEEGTPPSLESAIWHDMRSEIAPFKETLMAPVSREDLRGFLRCTGRSAPKVDRVQYDVLRHICISDPFKEADAEGILLRFINIIIRQREMPASLKQAVLRPHKRLKIPARWA